MGMWYCGMEQEVDWDVMSVAAEEQRIDDKVIKVEFNGEFRQEVEVVVFAYKTVNEHWMDMVVL